MDLLIRRKIDDLVLRIEHLEREVAQLKQELLQEIEALSAHLEQHRDDDNRQ